MILNYLIPYLNFKREMKLNASALKPVGDDCHKYWRTEFHAPVNDDILDFGKKYHPCAVTTFRSESRPHNKQVYR